MFIFVRCLFSTVNQNVHALTQKLLKHHANTHFKLKLERSALQTDLKFTCLGLEKENQIGQDTGKIQGRPEMEFKEFEPRFKSAKIRQNPV